MSKELNIFKFVVFINITLLFGCTDMNSNRPSLSLTEAFRKYIEMKTSVSERKICLNEGAKSQEINLLQQNFQLTDDSEILELYRFSNGQNQSELCASVFINGYDFLSIEFLIEESQMMKELAASEPEFIFWESSYIPIGADHSGNLIVYDTNSELMSSKWKVFGYENEDENFPMNSSLKALFLDYVNLIENGNYKTLDGEIFLNNGQKS